jgi:DNA polymerase
MRHLSIDLETYSESDIKLGIPKYVECPNFKILLFAYAWDFGEVHVVDLARGEEVPADVIDALTDPEATKHAFNAAFELHCLHRSGILTPYRQWACTQLHGLYLGYPKSLDGIGKALGLPQDKKKSTSGKALIRYFCLPCKPTKRNGGRTRNLPEHDPEKWEAFREYSAQDVVTEMEVCRRLAAFPVPDALQAEWVTDQKINRHGVLLDMDLVRGALAIDAAEKQHLMQEAAAITGLDNPNSRDQLLKWLNDNTNVEMEKLTKESVAEALEVADDTAAKLLDIRKRTSKTSVKKYEMMKNAAANTDNRVRGILQFYGANRTGRWAGRLIQGQNLPRNYIKNLDLARDLVRRGNREAVALLFDDVGDTLSQLIRTAIIAPEGKLLCISDFSAIEARVLAWLAGEKWVLEAFDRGEDIYCKTASSMFHVPVEKHGENGHLRQKGKIAVLACGYQGWTPALISMGALKMGLTEEELPDIVSRWRKANPRIVDFWQKVENAALYVMNTARPVGLDHGIIFARESNPADGSDFLTITLPSGRKLFYPSPHLAVNAFERQALHYRTQVGANWGTNSTYGGKLTENITQAVARDCLAAAITRLTDAGYPIVMHVHDEVVIEIDELNPEETLAEVNAFMGDPLPWAPGLHLTAAGFTSKYYMKD